VFVIVQLRRFLKLKQSAPDSRSSV